MKDGLPNFIIILSLLSALSSCDLSLQQPMILDENAEVACLDYSISIDQSKFHRKVLIIGIDGFRADMMTPGFAPFLYKYSQRRTTFYTNHHEVQLVPYSGPNWSSVLTGVNLQKHKVIDNKFDGNHLLVYPPVFDIIEKADSSKNTVSIVHWPPINQRIVRHLADISNPDGIADKEVFERGVKILQNQDPVNADYMFLHFVELDAAGHKFGFHPQIKQYGEVLERLDSYVEGLIEEVEVKRKEGEDWMIIIVSDHGGEGTGHIHRSNENTGKTILFINHPTAIFRRPFISSQPDIAPTIFDFIGLQSSRFDCYTDGQSIILEDY